VATGRRSGAAVAAWRWLTRPRPFAVSPLGALATAAGLAAVVWALPGRGVRAVPPAENAPQEFQFVVVAPRAARVALVGDFNDWDATRTPMRPSQRGGPVWTAVLHLSTGCYVYAFLVVARRALRGPWDHRPGPGGGPSHRAAAESHARGRNQGRARHAHPQRRPAPRRRPRPRARGARGERHLPRARGRGRGAAGGCRSRRPGTAAPVASPNHHRAARRPYGPRGERRARGQRRRGGARARRQRPGRGPDRLPPRRRARHRARRGADRGHRG